mmetsp:Transcript_34598/g.54008  ORF Transcript_34598/g.54008 Transcript_34598/m.54008 type:complete len:100 (-) Transcript_34598:865-1164(-)
MYRPFVKVKSGTMPWQLMQVMGSTSTIGVMLRSGGYRSLLSSLIRMCIGIATLGTSTQLQQQRHFSAGKKHGSELIVQMSSVMSGEELQAGWFIKKVPT